MTFTTRERTLAEVFPHEIGTIRAKLDKINRRLAKLGAPAATLTVAPVEERTEVDDLGFRRTFLVHPTVTVAVSRPTTLAGSPSPPWTGP